MNEHRQQPQQQPCTQGILDIPNAQSTPTQPQSASPGTARFFLSSPAVAMPSELWAGAEAGGAPDGSAEDANMGGIFGDEELERVFESIDGVDSGHLESVKREAEGVLQLATKEAGPSPDPSSSNLIKKSRWVGWSVNSTVWGPIKKWLPEACNADFLLAQETHLPQGRSGCSGGLDAIARMAGVHRAFWSSQHGEWVSTKQTARSKGSAGIMVVAALRHGLASSCASGAYNSSIVPGGA